MWHHQAMNALNRDRVLYVMHSGCCGTKLDHSRVQMCDVAVVDEHCTCGFEDLIRENL